MDFETQMQTPTPTPWLEPLLQHPPPILVFFAFFVTIYLLSYHLLFRHWPPTTRLEAASCAISLFHGTPAFLLASAALLLHRDTAFASPNTPLQSTILDFSLSYFATDLLHYLRFYSADLSFIAHHLATLLVFSTCRYLARHGASPVLLLALAESPSALHNAWTLARARRFDHPRAAWAYSVLSVPFYTVYTVARSVAGPVVVYRMWEFFYVGGGGDGVIPRWTWAAWIVVVVMAIAGSLLRVSSLWAELLRERPPAPKKDV